MKKIFFLLAFITLSLTMTSCKTRNQEKDVLNNTTINETATPEKVTKPSKSPTERNTHAAEQTEGYYILPDSDKKIISTEDLYILDDFTLRLAKNEIFARKGYIFKDESLKQYFSNMSWYKMDSTRKGSFDELNKIERKNVTLIDNHINLEYFPYADMYEKTTKDGRTYYTQRLDKDLNCDGVLEKITVCFYNYLTDPPQDSDSFDCCEIEIMDATGKTYSLEIHETNIFPSLRFADFDVNDNLLQFYINAAGPSADPSTWIYSFDGTQIISNMHMIGHITRYDGDSRLYSFGRYNVNCYYDLNNGLTPLPKENIVGTTITESYNIELFSKPRTGYTSTMLSNPLTDPDYKYEGRFKEEYIGVIPADTPLLITDIEFAPYVDSDDDEYYSVPWLKVKTPENIEGWFCLMYGD